MHQSSAWPLSWVYVGLIAYASLYPFANWHSQGVTPWAFLDNPWPRYWTGFDVITNVLGYVPLGFLWVLGALRGGRMRYALAWATLAATALSLLLESLQSYLPMRVASNLDLLLNALGGLLGAGLAWTLERLGWVARWSRFRTRWLVHRARGGLVLLMLWPLALLFPVLVPFGLGQVYEQLFSWLTQWLGNTPLLAWLPAPAVTWQPWSASAKFVCVTLGLLIPCWLGFCIIRTHAQRLVFMLLALLVGMACTALSTALSHGPDHAWAWLGTLEQAALVLAVVILLMSFWMPAHLCAALLLLGLGVYLSLLNQAPTDAYFAQTLFAWEQGRFIRFHGLAQWLGWFWPYATALYALNLIGKQPN